MATGQQPVNPSFLGGLARRLVADKLLTEDQARDVQQKSLKGGKPLVSLLVESKIVTPSAIAEAASQEFGAPLIDLGAVEIDPEIARQVSERVLRKVHALPIFQRGKKIYVAVSDPTNLQALDEIKFATGCQTESVLVTEDKLIRAIDVAATAAESQQMDLGDEDLENLEISEGGEEGGGHDVTRADAEDAPIIRYVNKIMVDAINQGASDIHFEPYEKTYRIRYRRDGELKTIATPPVSQAGRLAARVKVMSRLDLAERRVPQDGRIKLYISKTRAIDFRVSSCPTLFGEKIVCRILDPSSAKLGIDALGYEPEQKAEFMKALDRPQGMILVTGPTGSGKTVSLYTGLNILNTEDANISTAEDPAEINLPGINQVNVNPRVGLTFAAALKAFLRQDPDIIMVGEIRDLETAEIAIKAAQTGHLVLSTLHTNDAPQTIVRLMNMGVPAYNIASTLSLIIAQRLARKLCSSCKRPASIPKAELIKQGFTEEELSASDFTIFEAVGCDQCDSGYKGRTGIYQVMPFSDEMGRIIMEGGSAIEIADQAKKEGVADLRQSALKKVRHGVIDLLQANACTMGE
ncbi:type IV-A pilus assembly ATPase PilB [Sinimarinibacterium sp. CAU 1509]|uniref:type IV-A pilus assembly ATPase PilB n=1 Tax=Sinimarinibacterium sp. CAU 1509 TaxID=2562283 RepID=UPI0010AC940B|nr:type IV-A pilus assembly ATPase PilB [Sinimarinibacterium sp. CAU 1509]TJY65177.1 type IV-A pilus assembly ATPase PilB [Sinimarinibacterium sp. CAU 1509]